MGDKSKLTPQQEKFCQCIVSGMNQSDAYRASYKVGAKTKHTTVQDSASKLMANPLLAHRVAELRKPVVEKLQYGLEEAMAEAAQAFLVSAGKENGGAMVAAVTLKAKLQGLLIERKVIDLTTHEDTLDDLA